MSGGEVDFWTPNQFFLGVNQRYGPFTLDVAASAMNAKCGNYFSKDDNGLIKDWYGKVWCNPPYNNIGPWVSKAIREIKKFHVGQVCMLLPEGCSTKWFQLVYENADTIEFVHGRLNFGGPHALNDGKAASPNGSILVVFTAAADGKPRVNLIDRSGQPLKGTQYTLEDF